MKGKNKEGGWKGRKQGRREGKREGKRKREDRFMGLLVFSKLKMNY